MIPSNARRQKQREAAASVVQAFFLPKKSRAQPRPVVTVPPRGIGPVDEPNKNDVLCGRGGKICSYMGNIQFRNIVNKTKIEYLSQNTKKMDKAHIAAKIVHQIRSMNPPGRFLKEDTKGGPWFDIGDEKAIKKVCQALREDAPDLRQELSQKPDGELPNNVDTTSAAATNPTHNPSLMPITPNGTVMQTSLPPQMINPNFQHQQAALYSAQGLPSHQMLPQPVTVDSGASLQPGFSPGMTPQGGTLPFSPQPAFSGAPHSLPPLHPSQPVLAHGIPGQQFPQHSTQQFPQQTGQQFPQQTSQQFPQQTGQQFPQQASQQFPQQASQQFPQPACQQFPQSATQQFPQNSTQQFAPNVALTAAQNGVQNSHQNAATPQFAPQYAAVNGTQNPAGNVQSAPQSSPQTVLPSVSKSTSPTVPQAVPQSNTQSTPQHSSQLPIHQNAAQTPSDSNINDLLKDSLHSLNTPPLVPPKKQTTAKPTSSRNGNKPSQAELFQKLANSRKGKVSQSNTAKELMAEQGDDGAFGRNFHPLPEYRNERTGLGSFHPIPDEIIDNDKMSEFSGLSSVREGTCLSGVSAVSSLTAGTAKGIRQQLGLTVPISQPGLAPGVKSQAERVKDLNAARNNANAMAAATKKSPEKQPQATDLTKDAPTVIKSALPGDDMSLGSSVIFGDNSALMREDMSFALGSHAMSMVSGGDTIKQGYQTQEKPQQQPKRQQFGDHTEANDSVYSAMSVSQLSAGVASISINSQWGPGTIFSEASAATKEQKITLDSKF